MSNDRKMSLTVKVLLGMFFGIVVGLIINFTDMNTTGSFINVYIVDGLFFVVGKLFVNALKMLVVPLVFFSLICGVCGIGSINTLGRVGTKSFALYMLTTAVAIAVAISISASVGLGQGMELQAATSFETKEAPPLKNVLIDIVPSNPIKAMANGDMLPLIFFSILVGISILLVGKKASKFAESAEIANEIMMKMVSIIMAVAPYAVFALIARSISQLGIDLLSHLAGYATILIGSLFIHLFITLMIVLKLFSGLSPIMFIKKIRNTQVFAFSTASSNATIPITLRTATERLGVDNSVASFTVPFGATINMDGTAIMQGVATVFIANLYGLDLTTADYLTVILMSVLASIGTAGVPGVGLVMLSMVFTQVGLPVEGIGLILGVDRLMDMIRTAVNVSGDAVVSSIVAKSEGKLDLGVYNDRHAGAVISSQLHIDEKTEQELAKAVIQTHDKS